MGQFSYECTKCGKHDQFDWITACVVRIGNVYVEGTYDGYGGVEVHVTNNTGFGDSPVECTVMAYPEQFRQYFETWNVKDDSLLATEIYCDGEAGEGHHPIRSLHAFMLKQQDPFEVKDRYCAPKGENIRIQTSLHVWHLASLPKAVPRRRTTATTAAANANNNRPQYATMKLRARSTNASSEKHDLPSKAKEAKKVESPPVEW